MVVACSDWCICVLAEPCDWFDLVEYGMCVV